MQSYISNLPNVHLPYCIVSNLLYSQTVIFYFFQMMVRVLIVCEAKSCILKVEQKQKEMFQHYDMVRNEMHKHIHTRYKLTSSFTISPASSGNNLSNQSYIILPHTPCNPNGLSHTPASSDICNANSVASYGFTFVFARVADNAPAEAPASRRLDDDWLYPFSCRYACGLCI